MTGTRGIRGRAWPPHTHQVRASDRGCGEARTASGGDRRGRTGRCRDRRTLRAARGTAQRGRGRTGSTGRSAAPSPAVRHQADNDSRLGSQADLPPLLPSRAADSRTAHRCGSATSPRARSVVRRGAGRSSSGGAAVSSRPHPGAGRPRRDLMGLGRRPPLHAGPHRHSRPVPRLHLGPGGGTAYTPPSLISSELGRSCFNKTFTAFGDCRVSESSYARSGGPAPAPGRGDRSSGAPCRRRAGRRRAGGASVRPRGS